MACRRGCCCGVVNEDNARFLTLAVLIVLYLLCGAAVFSALEQPKELQANEQWAQRFERFTQKHSLNRTDLETFLRFYEEANIAGIRVDTLRPRWDFTGAFYFVGTVVSTIGFGMTTPTTVSGKVFLIFYGLIGCASTILFFNLFLERIITVLAFVLKSCHDLKRRRQGVMPHDGPRGAPPPGPRDRGRDSLAGWKPSVYYVMLILCVAAVVISCCASAMYSAVEGWGYLDSLYFCFVAFSTIGFGDMVSSQRVTYEGNQTAYRLGNFLFILMGVCCIYSLFNVISIVIKQVRIFCFIYVCFMSSCGCTHAQTHTLWEMACIHSLSLLCPFLLAIPLLLFLLFFSLTHTHTSQPLSLGMWEFYQSTIISNVTEFQSFIKTIQYNIFPKLKQTLNWLLRKLDIFSYRGCCHCCPAGIAKRLPPRRNAVMPSGTGHGHSPAQRTVSIETDALNESETDGGRRMSGEMISIRDFLAANKVRGSPGKNNIKSSLCYFHLWSKVLPLHFII
uniref:Tyrosyl-DNA phosphodiesterase 1 n=1 Tax=Oncorhynchus mykiss TaxID=8022 RepID=A0A8C7RKN3_ONCMY